MASDHLSPAQLVQERLAQQVTERTIADMAKLAELGRQVKQQAVQKRIQADLDRLGRDGDDDGLPDIIEEAIGSDPNNPNTDGEGPGDLMEVELELDPARPNTASAGTDDVHERSDVDRIEWAKHTFLRDHPELSDLPGDELRRRAFEWFREHGAEQPPDDQQDWDGDGLTQQEEREAGMSDYRHLREYEADPTLQTAADMAAEVGQMARDWSDFDGDGLPNVIEELKGTNPAKPDHDDDGLPDGHEVDLGLDPTKSHTQSGRPDAEREEWWLERYARDHPDFDYSEEALRDARAWFREHGDEQPPPEEQDFDRDGLTQAEEREGGTDDYVADADEDGRDDGQEREQGTDPLVPDLPATSEDQRNDESDVALDTMQAGLEAMVKGVRQVDSFLDAPDGAPTNRLLHELLRARDRLIETRSQFGAEDASAGTGGQPVVFDTVITDLEQATERVEQIQIDLVEMAPGDVGEVGPTGRAPLGDPEEMGGWAGNPVGDGLMSEEQDVETGRAAEEWDDEVPGDNRDPWADEPVGDGSHPLTDNRDPWADEPIGDGSHPLTDNRDPWADEPIGDGPHPLTDNRDPWAEEGAGATAPEPPPPVVDVPAAEPIEAPAPEAGWEDEQA